MAYGIEIGLGFPASALGKLAAAAGVPFQPVQLVGDLEQIASDLYDLAEPVIAAMAPTLQQISIDLFSRELGVPAKAKQDLWVTAGGKQFSALRLALYADPREVGDDVDEFIIGVSLTSRYQPGWVDQETSHGGLNTIVIDDPRTKRRIDEARAALTAAYPIFAEAQLFARFLHY